MGKLFISVSIILILMQPPTVFGEAEFTADDNNDEELLIRYPAYRIKELSYAQLQQYKLELLHLALTKSGRKFRLERVDIDVITSDRNMRNLSQGVYDVNWMHTSSERERALLPIRIPIYKGLIGWRLLLIRANLHDQFQRIDSLAQLKQFKHGQAYDWPDTGILKYHNFNLVEASSARTLMNMLKGQRLDVFPRSIVEIWGEYELHGDNRLLIDPNIVLVYPTAFYTFVDKRNPELAAILELGMELAIEDGSFDKLFERYFSEVIKRAQLDKRKIFRLTNPGLSELTPLHRAELWFNKDGFNKDGFNTKVLDQEGPDQESQAR